MKDNNYINKKEIIEKGTYTNYCAICGTRIYSYDDYCKDCLQDMNRQSRRNRKDKGDK